MAPDLFSFSNRVALITGGGSGIGAYVAKGLAETGASRVYIIGRRVAGVEATTQAAPNVIIPIVGDVGTSEGCRKIVEAFEGGEKKAGIDAADIRLDLLFNNAGIAHEEGAWGPGATPEQVRDALLKASDTDWAHEFAVNVSSVQVSATPQSILYARMLTHVRTYVRTSPPVDVGSPSPAPRPSVQTE